MMDAAVGVTDKLTMGTAGDMSTVAEPWFDAVKFASPVYVAVTWSAGTTKEFVAQVAPYEVLFGGGSRATGSAEQPAMAVLLAFAKKEIELGFVPEVAGTVGVNVPERIAVRVTRLFTEEAVDGPDRVTVAASLFTG